MSQTKAQLIDNLVQPIKGAAGSASAPTFSFTSDPNSGLYSVGADQLALSTGGTGRLFIDSSGNVGIGAAPSALLDVRGNIYSTGAVNDFGSGQYPIIRINSSINNAIFGFALDGNQNGAYNGRDWRIEQGRSATGVFNITDITAGNLVRLAINSSGTVGIGTNGTLDTSSLLHVFNTAGVAKQTIESANNSEAYINFSAQSSESSIGYVRDGSGNGSIRFTFGNTLSSNEALRIDSSQRLLMGTTSNISSALGIQMYNTSPYLIGCKADNNPTQGAVLMGVEGFSQSGSTFAEAGYIRIESGGSTTTGNHPGQIIFGTTTTSTSATERGRINSAGFTKISNSGGSGANRYLNSINHVVHSSLNDQWAFSIEHTGATLPWGISIEYVSASPNNTVNDFLRCNDSSTIRASIRSNGGIANYSGNNVNLCDEREKKNIVNLDSTWDCLKHWELKAFHYNEDADTDDKRYGVIAQQVAKHCPEVITEWIKQQAEEAVIDDEGNVVTPVKKEIVRMGVKEQQMYWMAIKALQEAQVRIEALEVEVATLKTS